jgi:hypothetical protein
MSKANMVRIRSMELSSQSSVCIGRAALDRRGERMLAKAARSVTFVTEGAAPVVASRASRATPLPSPALARSHGWQAHRGAARLRATVGACVFRRR